MQRTFVANTGFRERLLRAGVTDYAAAMRLSGPGLRVVSIHKGRSVVDLGDRLYLKRLIRRTGEARAELRAMELLARGPGPAPAPLAAWGTGPRGAFLVTASPDGALPLPVALEALEGGPRRDLLEMLGLRIRALHDRGLTCPDLLARHLLVARSDRLYLIDAGRLGRRSGLRHRARDLAELELSLPHGVVRRTDRARFLTAYLGEKPRSDHSLVRAVENAWRGISRRSRHRTERVVRSPADARFFDGHGLGDFDSLMAFEGPGATRLRVLADRENWRVELAGRVFFVKRHRPVKGLAKTPAAAEWEAVDLFRRSGVRAMRAAVLGEDVRKGSTIWVDRAPGEPLDDLLRAGEIDPAVRRELVLEAAAILRRMRLCEIHHRDMYCCHLFADATAPAGERLTVIDLQRARRRRGLRRRWYVKDIAQLLHSAPRPPLPPTHPVPPSPAWAPARSRSPAASSARPRRSPAGPGNPSNARRRGHSSVFPNANARRRGHSSVFPRKGGGVIPPDSAIEEASVSLRSCAWESSSIGTGPGRVGSRSGSSASRRTSSRRGMRSAS